MGFLNFIVDAGFVGWTIIATGIAGAALCVERARTLYFAYGLDVESFTNKIQTRKNSFIFESFIFPNRSNLSSNFVTKRR